MKKMIEKFIKYFLFGKPISGEPAYKKTKFKTIIPDSYGLSFEDWAKANNVSVRTPK